MKNTCTCLQIPKNYSVPMLAEAIAYIQCYSSLSLRSLVAYPEIGNEEPKKHEICLFLKTFNKTRGNGPLPLPPWDQPLKLAAVNTVLHTI